MRFLPAGLLLLLLLHAAPPARGWERASEIIHGSARVLEKGETIVGIVSPLAYGLVERVTVFTHPALLLLLTPNIWGRLNVLDGDAAVAIETGYQQSLLVLEWAGDGSSDDTASSQEEDPMPGYFQLGAIYSHSIGPRVQLTAALGYVVRFGEFTTDVGAHSSGLYWRTGGHFLFGEENLVLAEVRGHWYAGEDAALPTGTLLFARQLGRTRIGVGACFGDFPVSNDFDSATDPRKGESGDVTHLPVYPWLDLWWRF